MRISTKFRFLLTLLMVASLLSPTAMAALGEGKKQFKKGMKHEVAEEWDQAAEAFALAVADNPKNPEYRLHYIRSLFNASQMYMKRGRMLAKEDDYAGAYIAFRKAYAYDPVNELARTEMERMLRMQKSLMDGKDPNQIETDLQLVKTSLSSPQLPDDVVVPQRYEKLRDVPFPSGVDLQFLISELAKDLDLNVLFDTQSFRSPKRIKIELKNVTAAKALDYIFLQEGLFFEKVGPRTIIIAASTRRQFFQQLVLRTFYLANADPADVEKVIKGAIPAQPGRTPTIVLTDEDTNSLTVRDTVENIRLIEELIKSLDKDRAEVVMDVQIYEVSKSDLLQLGNQIGSKSQLSNLGGSTSALVRGNNPADGILDAIGKTDIFGIALAVPAATLVAFQRKDNTKLLASTQIHAFNNEDSSARIGQRVPVQTASVSSFNNGTTPGTGGGTGNIFGTGFPVINYEQVGLTLKFKPIVFPNQDVQVTMEIESKDIVNAGSLTPTFTERTIKGTARVQNNKTLLLASVAQGVESEGREGLPLLGMIPILGRFFTAPTKNNSQIDIVIAVTPRVIRAPNVLPEDVIERPTGSLAVPTSGSLDALLIREEIDRQQNLAKLNPKRNEVQLPGANVPAYVKTNGSEAVSTNKVESQPAEDTSSTVTRDYSESSLPFVPENGENTAKIKPIGSGNRTLDLAKTLTPGNSSGDSVKVNSTSLNSSEGTRTLLPGTNTTETRSKPVSENKSAGPVAVLQMLPKLPEMKKGERLKLAVLVKSATQFRSAVMGLVFDETKIAVRSVGYGDIFGTPLANSNVIPFFNQNGKMYVSLTSANDVAGNSSGVLSFVEIEALADGMPQIDFDPDMLTILTADGVNFEVRH